MLINTSSSEFILADRNTELNMEHFTPNPSIYLVFKCHQCISSGSFVDGEQEVSFFVFFYSRSKEEKFHIAPLDVQEL